MLASAVNLSKHVAQTSVCVVQTKAQTEVCATRSSQ